MSDLEALLRDTLHGRAATVIDAPPLLGAPDRHGRSRWLLVAATVAAVLVAGGGIAVWGLGRGTSSQHSGGGYARTCSATLPAAWKKASAAPEVTVEGHYASVVAVTSYGDVVTWMTGRLHQVAHVGLRKNTGTTRTLFAGAPDDSISTSVDGPDLVLSVAPTGSGQSLGPNVQDVVAIDLRTSTVRHLLPAAGMPAGDVVGDRAAVVLDGLVYWTAVPRGAQAKSGSGTVLAYDLTRHRASVVARHASLQSTEDERRGVFWTGGGVVARGVPAAVPGPRAKGVTAVVSDGTNFAWLGAGNPRVLGWADAAGDERRWSLDTVDGPGVEFQPIAVSGPFVFLEPMGSGDPHAYVLDTRTGATADSGIMASGGTAHGTSVAMITRHDDNGALGTVLVDTAHLPTLTC